MTILDCAKSNPLMILVVDDFRDGAEILCSLLTKRGAAATWASSGHEALAMIRAHPREQPLLVVLDAMMPQMDGIEVLKQIRSDPRISTTAVIMYSAGFDVAMRDEALTLGAVAWLLKGVAEGSSVDVLIATILKWYSSTGGVIAEPLRGC